MGWDWDSFTVLPSKTIKKFLMNIILGGRGILPDNWHAIQLNYLVPTVKFQWMKLQVIFHFDIVSRNHHLRHSWSQQYTHILSP